MTQYGSLPSPWYPGHPTGPTHRQQELTVPSASRKAALPAQSSHSAQSSGVGRTAAGAPVAPGVRGVARSPAPGAGASSVAWASAGARVGGSACGAGAQPSATRAASATARAEPRPSRRPRSGVLAPERPKIHRVVRGEDAAGRSILSTVTGRGRGGQLGIALGIALAVPAGFARRSTRRPTRRARAPALHGDLPGASVASVISLLLSGCGAGHATAQAGAAPSAARAALLDPANGLTSSPLAERARQGNPP